MRYVAVFAILLLLLPGCADQKESPIRPDQPTDPTPSYPADEDRFIFPPKVATSDQGTDVLEASLIPGDPEAIYDPAIGRIKAYTDFESFDEATGELTVITFEDLPPNGSSCPGPEGYEDSIPNPLTIETVTFDDSHCLESWFCSAPACPGEGILLVIHTLTTIDYPPETGGVMLAVEGIGDDPFVLRAEGWSGTVITVVHHGVPYGTSYVGFKSPGGIARVQFLGAITHGNLPLRVVYFERP